nr:phosphoesterase [uncultured Catonella sp.]
MNTFFIADLHFDDINIKNYENRPFTSVNAMNHELIKNWNKTVDNDDEVYLLGDIGNIAYIPMLNGSKYLVKGNHDTFDNNFYRTNGFTEVYDLPVIYKGFWILSHEPLYINNNMPYANIFGHIHGNPNYLSASSHGFCVSVERINYTPVSFETIQKVVTECKQ